MPAGELKITPPKIWQNQSFFNKMDYKIPTFPTQPPDRLIRLFPTFGVHRGITIRYPNNEVQP
jgi:hypothetical protein